MAKERRSEYLLDDPDKYHRGLKSIRYSKHLLYQVLCLGYDNDKTPKENKDLGCKRHFITRNPNREFCSNICRAKIWAKRNKDKSAAKQQRYRNKKKKELEEYIESYIDRHMERPNE